MNCIVGVVLYLVLVCVDAQSEQCSQPVGNADQSEYTKTNDYIFLLDVDHPAQCDGVVAQLSYCVYRPDNTNNNPPHQAFVALFRPNSNAVYTRVTDQFLPLSQRNNDITNDGFQFGCFTCDVPEDFSPLNIQEGDVFGVCQINPSSNPRLLNVVGTDAPRSNFLYVADTDDECMDSDMASNAHLQDLDMMEGYILQVHANITRNITTSSITPAATTAATTTTVMRTALVTPTSTVPNTGDNNVAIAASVVVVLLVLATAAIVILLGAILWRKRNVYFIQKRHLNISTQNGNLETQKRTSFTVTENASYGKAQNPEQSSTLTHADVKATCTDNIAYGKTQQKHTSFTITENASYGKAQNPDQSSTLTHADVEATCTDNIAYGKTKQTTADQEYATIYDYDYIP